MQLLHLYLKQNLISNIALIIRIKVAEKKPFQSRFLPNHQTKKDETESSSEEESSTEVSDEDDDDDDNQKGKKSSGSTSATSASNNRSSQSRDTYDTRRSSRDEPYTPRSSISGPSYSRDADETRSSLTTRSRPQHNDPDESTARTASNGYAIQFSISSLLDNCRSFVS